MRVAFVGAGIMGASMAANLLKAGHAVSVYARTPAKAKPLEAAGGRIAADLAGCVRGAEAVITIVGAPQDVEAVYFGHVLEAAAPGALLVDMTTSSPRLAERIHAAAKSKGLRALDAPVTGGAGGARDGTLTIMAGGDTADFEAAKPLLGAMGRALVHFGAPGNGQRAKLVNQIIVAQNLVGAIEGLAYAKRAGLDPDTTLHMLSNGTSDSKALRLQATKAIARDFTPGFYPEHFIKDMGIAIEEAAALGLDLQGLANVRRLYQALVERFPEARGTQEIVRLYLP